MKSDSTKDRASPSVRRSLVLAFARRYTSFLITVPTMMVVSRLLTPEQIGVFSVAMAVMTLVQKLRHFGIADFIVQDVDAGPDVVKSAFTLSIIVSWLLGAGIFFLGPPMARFYGDPGVGQVMRVLSCLFILLPFNSIVFAILSRNMEFGALYKIITSGDVVRGVSTVTLASLGFGYMSLAWAALASMVATSAGCIAWGRDYRTLGLGLSRWQEITRFGMSRTTGDVFTEMGKRSADIIVGRMLGMAAAGFYSRGYGLVNMFRENIIGAINAVAFPAFSQRHHKNKSAGELYLRSLSYVTGVAWPFLLFSAFMAFPAIRLAFGPQWDASVPILRWLALAAMLGTLIYQCTYYFTAIGLVNVATKCEVFFQSARVAITVAAALRGLEAVAASQVVVYVIAIAVYYPALLRKGNVSLQGIFRALVPSAVVTILSGVGPALVYFYYTPVGGRLWLPLLAAIAGAGMGWLVGIYWGRHPLWGEVQSMFLRVWHWRSLRTD